MGTFLQIKISDPELIPSEAARLMDGAVALARQLEGKFSAYDPESEVNQLNIVKSMKVSPELFEVISQAKKISRLTGGEFDVTVAPILKADGFYSHMPEDLLKKIPEGTGGVGWRNITVKPEGGTVMLRKGAWIDLSGIAKGYIVDRLSAMLNSAGVRGFIVNAGGDMFCGERADGRPWKIGVRDPGGRSVIMVLEISGKAVATSGDYENVVVDKKTGEVISHIIDPIGAKAVEGANSSVTVIAPRCVQADALATAMLAMGAEKAIALADIVDQVSIITINNPDGKRVIRYSKDARMYIAGEKR